MEKYKPNREEYEHGKIKQMQPIKIFPDQTVSEISKKEKIRRRFSGPYLIRSAGRNLEKLGIFCGRPVVVFISCHGSFLLFLVGQELTIHQQQELNFFQLIAERGLW